MRKTLELNRSHLEQLSVSIEVSSERRERERERERKEKTICFYQQKKNFFF